LVSHTQVKYVNKQRILMPFTRAVGGGSFVSASLLAKGLIELGHDVVALFPQEGPSVELFRRQGVPVRIDRLPVVASVKRTPRGIYYFLQGYLATWLAARRFLSDSEFDIVHCNDDTSILPWGLAARSHGKRCIWHVRTGRAGGTDKLRLRLAHKAVCISHFVAKRLPDTPKKAVLYNPVDTEVFKPVNDKIAQRQKLELPASALQLIQMGRDVDYKRPEWSVMAIASALKAGIDARLIFLGDFTPQRQAALRSRLDAAHQERLVFVGWVGNPQDYLACSDLLLHPASGEHFGRIFIEAAACGVPFVATNTGAAPELVAAVLMGFLPSSDGEAGFCCAVVNLLGANRCTPQKNAEINYSVDDNGIVPNARKFSKMLRAECDV